MSKERPFIHPQMQNALDWVDSIEGDSWYLEAAREFIYHLDEAGFDPNRDILVQRADGDLSILRNPEPIVNKSPKPQESETIHPEKIVEAVVYEKD